MKYLTQAIIYLGCIASGVFLHKFGSNFLSWVKGFINDKTVQSLCQKATGICGIVAIAVAVYTCIQSQNFFNIVNRPIPKIVIPQIYNAELAEQEFQIQLHNRGKNPLTNVRMCWVLLPRSEKGERRQDTAYFPIVEQVDVEQVTTNFKYSGLKNPNEGWLYIVVGIKSRDLDNDHYFTVSYCSLKERHWWKTNDKLEGAEFKDKAEEALLRSEIETVRGLLNEEQRWVPKNLN